MASCSGRLRHGSAHHHEQAPHERLPCLGRWQVHLRLHCPGQAPREQSPCLVLCRDGGKVLLLRKAGGKHGPGKWQMPGGSSDSKDADALATAEREAEDEVGGVPSHAVIGQIVLRR